MIITGTDDKWDKKEEVLRVSVIIPKLEVAKKITRDKFLLKIVKVVHNVLEPQVIFKDK